MASARFGKVVRDARTAARKSLKEVADQLGFTVAYLSDIERGNRNPPAEEVIRVWARLVGEDVERLLFLAQIERRTVELSVDRQRVDAPKNQVAVALARSWDELDDEEYQRILDIVQKRRHAVRPEE